jgi:regulator of protease activity HflC (stomatin/prohibitin superfamily)
MIGRILSIGAAVIIGLVAITLVFGSWFTIDQGERGVVLRNGAYQTVAEPGLNFKLPWVDDVEYVTVQTHNQKYPELSTYSRDQQPATIALSVNYRIPTDKVSDVYIRYGGEDGLLNRVINPRVLEHFKNVFGQFNAATSIQERARLNHEIKMALDKSMIDTGEPVIIESVQVENIDFSKAYEDSVEERMLAEVSVQKLTQNALQAKIEAQIVVTQAQAQADSTVAKAKAEGEATRIRGEAEAAAIDARGKALRENPALVDLVKAEKWDGKLPTTMVPDGTLPFMNVPRAGDPVQAKE